MGYQDKQERETGQRRGNEAHAEVMARYEAGLLQPEIDGEQQGEGDELRNQRQGQVCGDVCDPDGQKNDVTTDEQVERHPVARIELRGPVHAGQEAQNGHAVAAGELIQPAQRLDGLDPSQWQQSTGQERGNARQSQSRIYRSVLHSVRD